MDIGFTGAENMSYNPRAASGPRDSAKRPELNTGKEAGEAMTFQDSTESELRQQLREAWQQIAELQWQLQAEQQNSRKQDRLLASHEANSAESRNEHEQALADRDQDIADLEDEHRDIVTAFENGRRDGAKRAEPEVPAAQRRNSGSQRGGLPALADLLEAYRLQSNNREKTAELGKWERCVRLALDAEDLLDGRPAGGLEVEALLRRVVVAQESRSARSFVVQVELTHEISPRQAILCAWLFDRWLMHSCGPSSHDRATTICVSLCSVETLPEIRIGLSLLGVAIDSKLWREPLQASVAALQGYFEDDTSAGITVAFPATPLA